MICITINYIIIYTDCFDISSLHEYRCPEDPGKCLLGSVPDPCGCCPDGLCARLLGEPCWNESIPLLPSKCRNDGYCARNYLCELRSDLQEEVHIIHFNLFISIVFEF